jgi:hypothetical protein
MSDVGLQDAVKSYVQATSELSGGQNCNKECKQRIKQAKLHIMSVMKEKKLAFLELNPSNFLVLKSKPCKHPMTPDFAANAFKQFHLDPTRLNGTTDSVAASFGQFLFALQKHCSDTTDDLKLSKKKPMAALLFDEFSQPPNH